MNMGEPIGSIAGWILGPVGWPSLVIGVAPFLWLPFRFVSPAAYGFLREFVAPFLILLALLSIRGIWEAVRASTAERLRQPYAHPLKTARGKFVAAVVLFFSLLVPLKVPIRIAFAMSRPEMDAHFNDLRANPDQVRPPLKQVGVYEMGTELRPYMHGVVQIFVDGNPNYGFAYSRGSPPQVSANPDGWGHLQGPWYWFSDD